MNKKFKKLKSTDFNIIIKKGSIINNNKIEHFNWQWKMEYRGKSLIITQNKFNWVSFNFGSTLINPWGFIMATIEKAEKKVDTNMALK